MPDKQAGTYGITVTVKRELTEEEAEIISKTLDLAASGLRLHFKDDVVHVNPNKNKNPPPSKPK